MDSSERGARRPAVKSKCQHIGILSPALCWEEIRRRQADRPECDTCLVKGANLWLCLARGCSNVGCGLSAKHHSLVHGKEFCHYLTINLTTLRLWCFACEKEVFPGYNNPPFDIPDVLAANTLRPMARCEGSANSSPQRSTSGADDSDSDMDDDTCRPRGLTGLQNLGNTCYLNSAVQALSNCPPLTRFFLDCQGCIPHERSPMLSKSYAKLITELWHKKRLSYVVPSGIVSGIKAVHPMFRGYTQQDAQEFLRCFMDQLHEELKYPTVSSDEEDDDDEDEVDEDEHPARGREMEPESGIASPTEPSLAGSLGSGGGGGDSRVGGGRRGGGRTGAERQNSVDSSASSECEDYETCDSGLSSEMGSQADPSMSSDDNISETNELSTCLADDKEKSAITTADRGVSPNRLPATRSASANRQNKNRNSLEGESMDTVANQKEIKETANLLSKIETDNARNQGLVKSESGEYLDALSDSALPPSANTRSKTAAVVAAQQQQQQQYQQQQRQQHEQHQQLYQDVAAASRGVPASVKAASSGLPKPRKRKNIHYESVISHIFDGKILSSVQCLYCERVSTTKETFQDLSLPIPSKDSLQVLHSGHHPSSSSLAASASSGGGASANGGGAMGGPRGGACGDQLGTQSWFGWVFTWMKSFFVGPTITLRDCLSAFFSADELKGDNMYSCEQCKKLRNGLKYSKVLELPEVLCIHLKRFRHEFYSSKINTYISFPLHSLDMKPYLHKDCKSEVTVYNLVGVVCHHGTAGGGHYTAYCLNPFNDQWYEYDDMYVTEVDVNQVINCEAYVLFYRKSDEHMHSLRMKAVKLRESGEPSLMQFFVSKQWINRFNTFAEPGPISNRDFLCKHGGVPPHKANHVEELVEPLEQRVWELLYNRFGGGPVCNRLYHCQVCLEELDRIKARQKWEMESFVALNNEFMSGEVHYPVIHALSMAWFRQWEAFVKTKTDTPPGPIDNSRIMVYRNGQPHLRATADYGQLSPDMWRFLHGIYGGGPEAVIRQRTLSSSSSSPPPATHAAAAAAPQSSNNAAAVSSSSTFSSSSSVSVSSPSPVLKETGTTPSSSTTSAATSTTSPSSLPSPSPSPPLPPSSLSSPSPSPATASSSNSGGGGDGGTGSSSSPPPVPLPPTAKAVAGEMTQSATVVAPTTTTTTSFDNSSSSSSTSTLTPPCGKPKVSEGEEEEKEEVETLEENHRVPPKPQALSDSGDSVEEEEGSGSGSEPKPSSKFPGNSLHPVSGAQVGGMQEIKGIPQSMDVTRL